MNKKQALFDAIEIIKSYSVNGKIHFDEIPTALEKTYNKLCELYQDVAKSDLDSR